MNASVLYLCFLYSFNEETFQKQFVSRLDVQITHFKVNNNIIRQNIIMMILKQN